MEAPQQNNKAKKAYEQSWRAENRQSFNEYHRNYYKSKVALARKIERVRKATEALGFELVKSGR